MLPNFAYARPGSVTEAVGQLSSSGARVFAGGTDLLGCLHDGVFDAEKVVSLRSIEDLGGIRETSDGGLRIGAMTTISEVASNELVNQRYPGLAQAAGEVASPQLRNQGTLGGNLCQRPRCWYFRGDFNCSKKGGDQCYAVDGENHYHCIFGGSACFIVHPSDTAPALVALGGSVKIASGGGERTVPLEEFYILPEVDHEKETVLEPGEIVTEVVLPPLGEGWQSSYRKVRERGSWDFALASVALALRSEGGRVREARIILGGVAPVPWRSQAAEEELTGRRIDEGRARRVGDAAIKNAEPLDYNGYKVPLVKGVVEEALLAL
jgi:xanthine dehydrogenase YagS FAD-binding subunit